VGLYAEWGRVSTSNGRNGGLGQQIGRSDEDLSSSLPPTCWHAASYNDPSPTPAAEIPLKIRGLRNERIISYDATPLAYMYGEIGVEPLSGSADEPTPPQACPVRRAVFSGRQSSATSGSCACPAASDMSEAPRPAPAQGRRL
jgi:hypothetical protein